MEALTAICFSYIDLLIWGAVTFLLGIDFAWTLKIATKNQTKKKGSKKHERF